MQAYLALNPYSPNKTPSNDSVWVTRTAYRPVRPTRELRYIPAGGGQPLNLQEEEGASRWGRSISRTGLRCSNQQHRLPC